jgi:hypothetical protein
MSHEIMAIFIELSSHPGVAIKIRNSLSYCLGHSRNSDSAGAGRTNAGDKKPDWSLAAMFFRSILHGKMR